MATLWHDNYFTLHSLGSDDLEEVLEMLWDIAPKFNDIALGLRVPLENYRGEIKKKYEHDPKTLISKGNLDIVISMWLKLEYDCKQHGKPSWRILAHVVYDKNKSVYRKIVKEHPK